MEIEKMKHTAENTPGLAWKALDRNPAYDGPDGIFTDFEGCDSGIDTTPTGETIDLTPVGCQTPEGNARVLQAQQEWDSATHELANTLKRVIDEVFDRDTDKIARAEYYSELQTLIGIREVKQEAFLRAVCGQPQRPEKPKLKTYPATVNGKTVQVTIPED
jgi:hypothetical protein